MNQTEKFKCNNCQIFVHINYSHNSKLTIFYFLYMKPSTVKVHLHQNLLREQPARGV